MARFPWTPVCYWRNRSGPEVAVLLARGHDRTEEFENKWDPQTFDGRALAVSRAAN
jgi:hypothetical protein